MDNFWMVVRMYNGFYPADNRLRLEDRPKYMHLSRERAEIEMLRLKKCYPDDDFYLLETVAFAEHISGTKEYRVQTMEVEK